MVELTAIEILGTPLTLKCGLTLPNRFVKCPMQETLSEAPDYHPPVEKFRNLYGRWSTAQFGMIFTGQVQVDERYLSRPGDVVIGPDGLIDGPVLDLWKEWARIAQKEGTPACVQIAHPGRMSPSGAGKRPLDMPSLCPSVVPVKLADNFLERRVVKKLYGGPPKEMSVEEIDEVVGKFVVAAKVVKLAGFKAVAIHAAHGFLISQFLSPYTNRRTDDYGGTPEKRLKFLQRIVIEVREAVGPDFCVGVKLNSGDYMKNDAGLMPDEAIEQVRWLLTCGLLDMCELSGGNAEGSQGSSRLALSLRAKSIDKAPVKKESTRIREGLFDDFARRVQEIETDVAVQLSGGFRSRVGMADAVESKTCDLIGLGRAVVLDPHLCRDILLNPEVSDTDAFAASHAINGRWIIPWLPVKAVGASLSVQFFYYNMRRLGAGLSVDRDMSLVTLLQAFYFGGLRARITGFFWRMLGYKAIKI